MTVPRASRLQIVNHVAAAIVGGYAFTWGFISLAIGVLFFAGLDFHDAESLASLVGYLVFLTMFLWTFGTRRLNVLKLWIVLVGGGGLMAAAASLVQQELLSRL